MELKTDVVVNFYEICDTLGVDPSIVSESDFQVIKMIVDELDDFVSIMFHRYPELVPFYGEKE